MTNSPQAPHPPKHVNNKQNKLQQTDLDCKLMIEKQEKIIKASHEQCFELEKEGKMLGIEIGHYEQQILLEKQKLKRFF